MQNKYDVIILGGGIAGLTCAGILAKNKKRVLLLERHHQVGGYCTSFKRKGFVFDAAVHHIGGCGRYSVIGRLLAELGASIDFQQLNPMDHLVFDDRMEVIPSDIDDFKTSLKRRFAKEAPNIDRWFKDIVRLYRAVIQQEGEILDHLQDRTYKDFLEDYFQDQTLLEILSAQYGYIGPPPENASAIGMTQMLVNYWKDGAYYPKGGTQRFSNALADSFIRLGGELKKSAPVTEIMVDEGRCRGVKVEGAGDFYADMFVSAMDIRSTFRYLIRDDSLRGYRDRLAELIPSNTFFLLYLGLGPEADLSSLPRGFYFRPLEIGTRWLYLTVPTEEDDSLAPPGRKIVNVVVPLPNLIWEENDMHELKEIMTQKTLAFLEERVPGIRNQIEVMDAASPATLHRYTHNSRGAAYGWAVLPEQSGKERLSPISPIKNLYLAGHWTSPGPGVNAVAASGWRAAQLIIRNSP